MSTASGRTAEDVLVRDYERLRGDVLMAIRGRLNARRIMLDDADLDAVYNQAWHALYDRLAAGEDIENPSGFLVTVGYRRAIEELRRQRLDQRATDADLESLGVDHDVAARLDDAIRLRQLVEGMKERLDERESKAAALCLIHGYSRPEAAGMLGESAKRMEKVMDAVQRKLGGLTADIATGDWCRSRRSLIKAYALGLLEPDGARHTLATQHLGECPACRRYVNSTRGLAALLPPVALPLPIDSQPLARMNALLDAAWRHGGELLGGHAVEAGAGAAAAGAGATVGHGAAAGGGAAAHGGPGPLAAKVGGVCAVGAACATVALAAMGAFGSDHRGAAGPPAPTVAAKPSTGASATAAAPKSAAKPHKKKSPKKQRKKRKPRPVSTPTAVVTSAPAPAPAPTVTQAAPAPAPTRTIVTDAKQEFGGK